MADSQDLRQLGSGAAWNRFVGDKPGHAQWMSFGIGIWFGPRGETVVVSLMRNQTLMARRLGLASTLPGCGNWLRDQVFISQVCVKGGLWCTFVGGPDALIDWIRRKKGLDHKTQDGRSYNTFNIVWSMSVPRCCLDSLNTWHPSMRHLFHGIHWWDTSFLMAPSKSRLSQYVTSIVETLFSWHRSMRHFLFN